MIRLALVLAILWPSLLSAAIHVGPERPVIPGFGVAAGSQFDVSMATSGEETLVAWIDPTRGRTGAYLAVLSREGELIAGSHRWLAADTFDVTVTWTGIDYLALWRTPLGTMASTLDRHGSTVVEPRLVLAGSARSNVAWAGSRGMLVYTPQGEQDRLQAALLDRQGNVTRVELAIPSQRVRDVRVGSDGTSFFIFWSRRDGVVQFTDSVFAARYTIDGMPQDTPPDPLWSDGGLLEPWDVAFDGQRFALVLSRRTSETATTVHRVLLDAATLEPTTLAPIDLGIADAAGLEWTGTHFLAFWMQHASDTTRELRTVAFSAADEDGAPVSVLGQLDPSVDSDGVWNGHALVVAWASKSPARVLTDVLATAIPGGGQPSVVTVSLSHRWQALAAIATNGNESLVVWIDGGVTNTEPKRIVSAHATGGVIDQAPRQHSETSWHVRPVVVFTGTMYLVVFSEIIPGTFTSHIALRRIDASGMPLDPSAIHLDYGSEFSAAWNGTHLLVAYDAHDDIQAVRIAHDGTIAGSTPSKIVAGGLTSGMSVASNGSEFLLAWNQGLDVGQPTPGLIDVYAIAISAAGNAIGAPIAVATGPGNQRLPAVASDGRDYVIAYMQDQTLTAKKVLREGTLADTTAQADGTVIALRTPFPYTGPAIAATPAGFMVAWELEIAGQAGELWLARLDRNAAVAVPPRAVVRSKLFEMQPTLASVNNGAVDLAYSRLVDEPSYGATMRVFIRRVEEGPGRSRSARH